MDVTLNTTTTLTQSYGHFYPVRTPCVPANQLPLPWHAPMCCTECPEIQCADCPLGDPLHVHMPTATCHVAHDRHRPGNPFSFSLCAVMPASARAIAWCMTTAAANKHHHTTTNLLEATHPPLLLTHDKKRELTHARLNLAGCPVRQHTC